MSLNKRFRMLGVDNQRASRRTVEPGADPGVFAGQRCGTVPRSVSLLLIHYVDEWLAFGEAADVFLDCADHARMVFIGAAGDVRGDDRVVELPERVAFGQWL